MSGSRSFRLEPEPFRGKGHDGWDEAAKFMADEGFLPGSCVYLDLEDGSLPQKLSDYTASWIQAVTDGGFQPGVYCSHVIADKVNALAPNLKIWALRCQRRRHMTAAVRRSDRTIRQGVDLPKRSHGSSTRTELSTYLWPLEGSSWWT